MAQPVLILHVGPHKTGTTALQLRLLTARDHLQQHGYDYPLLGLSQYGHHRLNSFLDGDAAGAGDVTEAALGDLASSGRNVILSSEDLIYQSPERLERLRALLGGFRIEVVMFVRSPVELWPSHWQQLVNHGREESLLEYVGAMFGVNTAIDPRTVSPVLQAQRFAQAFGRRNVRMFCYNNIVADGIDLFEFFVEVVLGLPPLLPRLPTVVINASLGAAANELLRSLNERYRQLHGRSPQTLLTVAYQKLRSQIEADPHVLAFGVAFAKYARTLILDSDTELFRKRDHQLLRLLGDRIENLAAPDRIYTRPYRRSIPYGTPYWASRFGFAGLIDDTLALLTLPPPQQGQGGLPSELADDTPRRA